MKKVTATNISGIPATMFFPLYARALETERNDAIFKNSYAVRMKDSIDLDFSIF